MTFEQGDEALDRLLAASEAAALERLRMGIDVDCGRAQIMIVDLPSRHDADEAASSSHAEKSEGVSPGEGIDRHRPAGEDLPEGDRLENTVNKIQDTLELISDNLRFTGLNSRWRNRANGVSKALGSLLEGLNAKVMKKGQAIDLVESCARLLKSFRDSASDRLDMEDYSRMVIAIDYCSELLDVTVDLVHRLFDASEDGVCAPARG